MQEPCQRGVRHEVSVENGQVKFNPNWSVSGEVKFADGDAQYFVGPRYTF